MADYDGDIKLKVSLSPEDAIKSTKGLQKDIEKIFQAASGKELSASFKSMENSLANSSAKAQTLMQKMDALATTKIPTQQYADLQKQFNSIESKASRLIQRQQEMEALGKGGSEAWKKLDYEIEELGKGSERVLGLMSDMEDRGKAFTLGSDSAQFQKLTSDLAAVNNQMLVQKTRIEQSKEGMRLLGDTTKQSADISNQKIAEINSRLSELKEKQQSLSSAGQGLGFAEYDQTVQEIQKLESALSDYRNSLTDTDNEQKKVSKSSGNIGKTFGKLAGIFKKLGSAISVFKNGLSRLRGGFSSARSGADGFSNGLGKNLKTMLKYAFGVEGLIALFNRFRRAGAEAFSSLAKQSAQVDRDISMIRNAFNQLKGSLATAFQPILSVIAPVLTQIIHLATQAMNAVGSFFAILTGQKFIYKAVESNESYAASMDKSTASTKKNTKAVEDNQKQLGNYDKLNIIEQGKDKDKSPDGGGSGGGGTELSPLFEKAEIDPAIKKLIDSFEDIWKVFAEAWEQNGEKTIEKAKKAFESIKKMLAAIGKSFRTVFTEGTGLEYLNSIFRVVNAILDVVRSLADAFTRAWEKGKAGDKFVRSLFKLWTAVNNLIADIGETIASVFDSDIGTNFFGGLIELGTTLSDLIASIVTAFEKAWNKNNTGYKFVQSLMKMFTDIGKLINAIGKSIAKVFNSDLGVDIFKNILEILTNINGIVSGLATSFTRAWEKAGNGDKLIRSLFTLFDTLLIKINGITKATKEWAETLNFEPLIQSITSIFDGLNELVKPVLDIITNFYKEVLLPLGKWTIERSVPSAFRIIGSAMKLIAPIIKGVGNALKFIWDNFLGKIFKVKFGIIGTVLETVASALEKIANNKTVTAVLEKVGFAFTMISSGLVGLVSVILNVVNKFFDLGEAAKKAWNVISGAFGKVKEWFGEKFDSAMKAAGDAFSNAKTTFSNIWKNIQSAFSNVKEWFGTKFKNGFTAAKNAFSTAKGTFGTAWSNIKSAFSDTKKWFGDKFGGAWGEVQKSFKPNTVTSFFKNVWGGIKSPFGNTADWFRTKFSNAWEAVKKVFSSGGKVFSGIKDGILSGLKAVINMLISGINKVISIPFNGLNAALNKIRNISIPVAGKVFSGLPTISVPQIPKLAQGAVIPPNKEFLAMLGDQKSGTNIEAPLDTIKQAVAEVMEQSGGGTETIQLVVDGRVLAEVVRDENIKRNKQLRSSTLRPVFG